MSAVKSSFIEPLVMAFALPSNADRDMAGWLSIYDEQLNGFTSSVLAESAKHIIATHKVRSFPLVSECIAACRAAQESAMLRARADRQTAVKRGIDPAFDDWRRKSADKLFATELGRQALKEDWGWTLHDWLMSNQRQPDKHEIEQIRKNGMSRSKRFWELVGCDDGVVDKFKINFHARQFIKWREAVNDRLKQVASAG